MAKSSTAPKEQGSAETTAGKRPGRKPKGYWTKERIHEEALKYSSRKKFRMNSPGAASKATLKGWFDEVCSHMPNTKKPWTIEACMGAASQSSGRKDFRIKFPGAYNAAWANGWLDEIFGSLSQLPPGYWDLDRCKIEALKYDTRNEFLTSGCSAYGAALRGGFLDEICSHMKEIRKPKGHWDLLSCKSEAKLYDHISDFRKGSSGACKAAKRNGWISDVCSHMERKKPLADVVYIWRAEGCRYAGKQVYKIGVSSTRSRQDRYTECARANNVNAVDIHRFNREEPRLAERKALEIGDDPKFKKADGYTEFRALSPEEYDRVLAILSGD